MVPFLKEIAQKCYEEYGQEMDQLTVVFPNRRAGLFFGQYLSEIIDKPHWLPSISTLEDFIQSFSSMEEIDPLKANFSLYASYKNIVKEAEPFDKFYFWGNMILQDFNEVDNYLIDPQHIFHVVSSQKELDESFFYLPEEHQKVIKSFWSGFLPKASKTQVSFLSTWRILNQLYTEFTKTLRQQNLGYKGMIYRSVVDHLEVECPDDKKQPIWFVGFNALNGAEEKVIKYFIEQAEARMYWDVDEYYLRDKDQEAGYFFREHLKDSVLGPTFPTKIPDNINDSDKAVSVTAVALDIGQIKSLASKIAEKAQSPDYKPQDTVVILPDEYLLVPLLNSIPEKVDKVNVTMGLPLNTSRFFILFELLIKLNSSIRLDREGRSTWYHKQILPLLNDSLVQELLGAEATTLRDYIVKKNRIHLSQDEIVGHYEKAQRLFVHETTVHGLLVYFMSLAEELSEAAQSVIDKAALFELQRIFRHISREVEDAQIDLKFDAFHRIWRQMGTAVKVPFTGEPLEGLQVMGVLESRNLDFKHVYILSMNEGKWPGDGHSSSFIPYNVRRAFDLPVVDHFDALQSYLFYRIVQRSEEVNIYYNNVSEFNHNGELSRFVKQLELESVVPVTHNTLINPVGSSARKAISIEKSTAILSSLKRFLMSEGDSMVRLSPSALNVYLDCRLKFYFKQVQRIPEIDGVDEDLEPAMFGNLLHYSMEHLYGTFLSDKGRSSLYESDMNELRGMISTSVQQAFVEYQLNQDQEGEVDGRALIAISVIEKYVEAILNHDKKNMPFKIVGIEVGQKDGYVLNLPIDFNGRKEQVGLKGIIDRIDEQGDHVRILDYKSGRDQRKFPTLESLFDRTRNDRNKAAMQVFYYCLLYKAKSGNSNKKIAPGLYNSRDLFLRDFDVRLKQGRGQYIDDFSLLEDEYTTLLQELVQEIFDVATPFDQTDDLKKCGYCPYNKVCMRN